MKRQVNVWLILYLVLLWFGTSMAENQVVVTIVKSDSFYTMFLWADVNDANIIELKVEGPNMTGYEPADINESIFDFGWSREDMNLSKIQTLSQGTWTLKFMYEDDTNGIYTFEIKNGIEANEFLPQLRILEPLDGDVSVIAEHYTFCWDPNGAADDANILSMDTGLVGVNLLYSESIINDDIDPCMTTWAPGWLETGSVYFRAGYCLRKWEKTSSLTYDDVNSTSSAPEIKWEPLLPIPVWMTGERIEFEVTKTLDLNDDDIINFEDLAFIAAHWLETRQ